MIKKPDGTLFEIRARKFRYMVRNKVYVLFLKEVPSSEGVFTAVRGPQGIYELRRDNLKVLHHGRPLNIPPDSNPPTITAFFRELRDLARQTH